MPTSVKIDFLVPGFSKCGTTTLCALLGQHPDIYIPSIKEPWYFSSGNFENQHQHYDNHFAPATEHQLKGEGSVSYSGAEHEDISIERIYANNSQCRFIFIARNPRQRIESSYREMHHSGALYGFNAPFALGDCLSAFPQMLEDTLYWQRIKKYQERFGTDSILVIFLEDLKEDVTAVLARCFAHLGLKLHAGPSLENTKLNDGQSKRFDTKLLRYIRSNPYIGFKLARFAPATQDKFLTPLRLRRQFGHRSIGWDEKSLEYLHRDIYPDSRVFLKYYNKLPSIWDIGLEA